MLRKSKVWFNILKQNMDSSVKSKSSKALILFKHCKKLFLMSINKKNKTLMLWVDISIHLSLFKFKYYYNKNVRLPKGTIVVGTQRHLSLVRKKQESMELTLWMKRDKLLFFCVSVPMTNFKWGLLFRRVWESLLPCFVSLNYI